MDQVERFLLVAAGESEAVVKAGGKAASALLSYSSGSAWTAERTAVLGNVLAKMLRSYTVRFVFFCWEGANRKREDEREKQKRGLFPFSRACFPLSNSLFFFLFSLPISPPPQQPGHRRHPHLGDRLLRLPLRRAGRGLSRALVRRGLGPTHNRGGLPLAGDEQAESDLQGGGPLGGCLRAAVRQGAAGAGQDRSGQHGAHRGGTCRARDPRGGTFVALRLPVLVHPDRGVLHLDGADRVRGADGVRVPEGKKERRSFSKFRF